MDPAGGLGLGLSIVGLVVVIRILLIPLFVKQIKAQRGLQILQPEIKKIQAKYKGKTDPESRQKQQQEMMKLYKDNGTNPLASCLPILLQAPIFFALFHVLNGIGKDPPQGKGFMSDQDAAAGRRRLDPRRADLGQVPRAPTACTSRSSARVLIVLMSATTFLTQKQLMSKNMPADAMNNPFAQQQKILLYVFPLVFAVSGVNFPIGVLLYWLTTNVWSMGQQFYVIRRNPVARLAGRRGARTTQGGQGGPAPTRRQAARRPRAAGGATTAVDDADGTPPPKPSGQRQQPKRTKKPKGAARPPGAKPAGGEPGAGERPPDAATS